MSTNKKLTDKKSIVEKIITEIKNDLIRGNLEPGGKFPTEKELTERYGVSRGAVREATKMLVALGVVEIKRGNGTYITKNISPSGLNQLIFSLIQKRGTPQELLELREMMELGVLEIVLNKATQKDIEKMERAIEKMEMTYKNGVTDRKILGKLDLEFHYAFAEATHNPLIIELFNSVMEMFLPTIEETLRYDIQFKPKIVEGVKVYRKILQAIKERDVEKAKKTIYESLEIWKKRAYHRFFKISERAKIK